IDEYPNAVVLDLGCGGGHVAYNVARHADLVFAYDLSHEMLDTNTRYLYLFFSSAKYF
ncbi:class I SAM-dependent methyltransferase, partial [Acinetobacter baumannii]|nr:class I SAM-dependent methyltransferase [Acinetobacter baumannii]